MNRRSRTTVAALVGATILFAGCTADAGDDDAKDSPSGGSSAGDSGSAEPVQVSFDPATKKLIPDTPVDEWCGDDEVKMGVADGVSFNKWRQLAFKVMENQVAMCPAVDPNIVYVSANGDQQKAISDINSLVAQGVDLIITNDDFGNAMLPAYKKAVDAGVKVVTYASGHDGVPGVDVTAASPEDAVAVGKALAEELIKALDGKGTVLFLGGPAGAPLSVGQYEGFKQAIADHPDMKLVPDEPVVTNWALPDAQKATTALLAKNPDIDAIYADYGPTGIGAINAFEAAGLPVPPVAAVASGNDLLCLWQQKSTGADRFEIITADSTHAMPLAGVQQGIAAATGADYNPMQLFALPIVYNSLEGRDPVCDPSLPGDADFTGPLSDEEMVAVLND